MNCPVAVVPLITITGVKSVTLAQGINTLEKLLVESKSTLLLPATLLASV